jgi:hypothetical protein
MHIIIDSSSISRWFKPLAVLLIVAMLTSGCKTMSMGGGSSGGGSSGGGSSGGGSSGGGSSGGGSSGGGSSGGVGMPGEFPGDMNGGSVGGIPRLEIPDTGIPGVGGAGSDDCGGGNFPGGMEQNDECKGEGESAAGKGATAGEIGGAADEGEAGRVGDVGRYPSETDAQRAERLGEKLDKSIGDFDEVLMEEQREISAVSRNTEGFGTGDESRPGGSVGLGRQADGGNSTSGTISILNPTEGRKSSVDNMSEEEIRARLPDDIIDNVDNDIIAKQLYEAALAEDDPVLRERLWEEYRKYNDL